MDPGFRSDGRFATTHWSVVLAAGQPDSSRYQQALEALCQTYWFPLYAFLRRQGHNSHQAEEYTQAFFMYLLEKKCVASADRKRGKFRSFLLATLKHVLTDERDRLQAKKRGGAHKILSLDIEDAETRYSFEPADELTPEKLFEKSWALTVLDRTVARLKDEFSSIEKLELFDHLKSCLTRQPGSLRYRDIAVKLGMTEGAVKVAVHRLRGRYRELLRNEIAQTVTTEDQIDEEIRELFSVLSS
jgi:RNA polymerase sigma-70 factor (ECF subfamily)